MLNKKQIFTVWLVGLATIFILIDLYSRLDHYRNSEIFRQFIQNSFLLLPIWILGGLFLLSFEKNPELKIEWIKRIFWVVILYAILTTPFIIGLGLFFSGGD